jgi:hypothetical protein
MRNVESSRNITCGPKDRGRALFGALQRTVKVGNIDYETAHQSVAQLPFSSRSRTAVAV